MRERRDPELTVRTNRREYVIPRQIAMYIARQLTGASLQEIGREFGHRHHTTVLHCIRKIEKLRCSDDAVDRAITQVMNAVGLVGHATPPALRYRMPGSVGRTPGRVKPMAPQVETTPLFAIASISVSR